MSDGGEGKPAVCVRPRKTSSATLHKMAETLTRPPRVRSKAEPQVRLELDSLVLPAHAKDKAEQASPATVIDAEYVYVDREETAELSSALKVLYSSFRYIALFPFG